MRPVKASLGFSRGRSFFPSQLIRIIDGGKYNHVYFRFDFEPEGSLIYESHLSGGVQITPYCQLESALKGGAVECIDEVDLCLSEAGCAALYADCTSYHGKAYDKWQILRYMIWMRLFNRKKRAGDKILKLWNDGKFTCNEFVVSAGRQTVALLADCDYSYTIEPLFVRFHSGMSSRLQI